MNTPLITWTLIVGLFIIILIVRLFRIAVFCSKNKGKLMSFMSERDMFFVPGDPNPRNADAHDYEFFEDL